MPGAPSEAYTALLAQIRDRVLRFAASRMSREDAEDRTQEVMIVLMEKVSQYGSITTADDIYRLALNILAKKRIGWYRKRHRRGEDTAQQVDVMPLRDPSPDPEQALGRKRLAQVLGSAVAGMDERCQQVIGLSLRGYGSAEIQKRLGMASENAVLLAVSRCRKKLREMLDASLLGDL
jgi:RNA polymerase sigma-70 factor (ECF subfamily)